MNLGSMAVASMAGVCCHGIDWCVIDWRSGLWSTGVGSGEPSSYSESCALSEEYKSRVSYWGNLPLFFSLLPSGADNSSISDVNSYEMCMHSKKQWPCTRTAITIIQGACMGQYCREWHPWPLAIQSYYYGYTCNLRNKSIEMTEHYLSWLSFKELPATGFKLVLLTW